METAGNHHGVIRILLKHGAPIAARDSVSRTPLHFAAQCKNVDGVKVLLEHGAEMMSRDISGDAPTILVSKLKDKSSGLGVIGAHGGCDRQSD